MTIEHKEQIPMEFYLQFKSFLIHENAFENIVYKWWSFCSGLNVLT